MSSVNRAIIIGNVGQDPDIRTTQSGQKIANFSIATGESWKDKVTGERKEKTEWHRVSVFNDGLCGVIEKYVTKGSKVYIEGQLETRKWQDKDGQDKYTTEIVLRSFGGTLVLLDSKENNSPQKPAYNKVTKDVAGVDGDFGDSVPFTWIAALIVPALAMLGA